MGMSSDYLIALEQGSTMVRIGSAILRTRNKGNPNILFKKIVLATLIASINASLFNPCNIVLFKIR